MGKGVCDHQWGIQKEPAADIYIYVYIIVQMHSRFLNHFIQRYAGYADLVKEFFPEVMTLISLES